MNTKIYEHELTLDDDRDVTVGFTYSPYVAATMYDRNGDPGSPEEGPEIDLEFVRDASGNDILEGLDDAQINELKQRILEDWDPE